MREGGREEGKEGGREGGKERGRERRISPEWQVSSQSGLSLSRPASEVQAE